MSVPLCLSPSQKDSVMGKSIQMGSQVNRRPTSVGERGERKRGTAARSSVHIYLNGAESHMQKLPRPRRHLLVLDDGDIAHIKEKEERKRGM